MLYLDKNDPLDRVLLQELNGEPIQFDDLLDAIDELEEEVDCAQVLEERGLCVADVLQEAVAYRKDFCTRLQEQGFPLDNPFHLCKGLFSQAQKEPSPELLRIYCEILCASDFLLGCQSEDEEQIILQYLDFCSERDALLERMTQRQELARKFSEATKGNRNPQPADCDTNWSYEIARCFTELFELPPKGNGAILLDNLSNYIQIAASSPALKAIEPLLLFRLLTRHKSRMCTVPDLNVNLSALWKRDTNKVDQDNGRNFKQYQLNLQLFTELCQLYQNDSKADLALCWYGLDQVTVLGDFYREHISFGWEYADEEPDFPLISTVEELVEDALFSCFENGYGDNVLLNESGLTVKELWDFQESPLVAAALEKISDEMNRRVPELILQFSRADEVETKNLCKSILEQSKIRYQPKSIREVELFLSAINNGLMECQDWAANCLLTQTGHALLREPTESLEWLE